MAASSQGPACAVAVGPIWCLLQHNYHIPTEQHLCAHQRLGGSLLLREAKAGHAAPLPCRCMKWLSRLETCLLLVLLYQLR